VDAGPPDVVDGLHHLILQYTVQYSLSTELVNDSAVRFFFGGAEDKAGIVYR
jgi:hypothetical protein